MNPIKRDTFRVALTADFYDSDQRLKYQDIGLATLEANSGIVIDRFDRHLPEIDAGQLQDAQGVIVLTPRVTAASLAKAGNLLAIGRFGVGYDSVDVAACTAADVALFITPGAVDRPVAEATVGWMIALSHHALIKDRLVREGRWDDRSKYMGSELRDRVFGTVGMGGIARGVLKLLASFGMKQSLAYDPYLDAAQARDLGVKLVGLDELCAEADFISIHCPLTEQTRNLIDARRLGLMKPTAYLVNTARGGIVDEDALFACLTDRRIAGAALDCFVGEPVTSPHRFGTLDNVLLAPHSIAWTNELFRDIGLAACRGMLDLATGRKPAGVVNPEVFDRPGFREKWERLRIQ